MASRHIALTKYEHPLKLAVVHLATRTFVGIVAVTHTNRHIVEATMLSSQGVHGARKRGLPSAISAVDQVDAFKVRDTGIPTKTLKDPIVLDVLESS